MPPISLAFETFFFDRDSCSFQSVNFANGPNNFFGYNFWLRKTKINEIPRFYKNFKCALFWPSVFIFKLQEKSFIVYYFVIVLKCMLVSHFGGSDLGDRVSDY